MTVYEGDFVISDSEETCTRPPRVCVIMPRFYPIFTGHGIQMMKSLPYLNQAGVSTFVVTGMVEGDPETNSVRDLLRGWKGLSGRQSWKTSSVVRSFLSSIKQTVTYIKSNPLCFKQPSENLDGVDIYRLPTWGPLRTIRTRLYSLAAAYYLVANRQQYDIIHVVGTSWYMPFSILLAKLLGKKVVVEMILLGADDPESIARRRFGKLNFLVWKQADQIVSLSTALTRACLSKNIPPQKITRIPVGVEIHRFHPVEALEDQVALRNRLQLPLDGKLVVFVGGIIPRKGVDLLIDAWTLVNESQPDSYLILVGPIGFIAGGRVFFEEQQRKIADANLEDKIIFVGRADNVQEYLQASDVFILPSVNEGLPNSVLEAMACGLPPIMSDIPGISEDIIRTPQEGVVVSEREPRAFANAIEGLLRDPHRRRAIGCAARKRIVDSFSMEYRTACYADLYYSLLENEKNGI